MAFKRNFLWMLASRIVQMSAGLFMGALINRSLGPAGRGIYAEVLTWVTLFVMVFGLSMDTAIYHLANRSAYGDDDASKFTTILWLNLGYSLLAMVGLSVLVHYWSHLVSATTAHHVFLLAILILVTMLATNLLVFYQAVGNIKAAAVIGMVQLLVQSALIIAAFLGGFLSLPFIFWSMVIMQVAALILLLGLAWKSGLIAGRFSLQMAKIIWSAGLKQHVATICTFAYTKINQLILFRYWGETATGVFSVSLAIALALMFIPQTFQTVLYPRVIHGTDDYEVTVRALRVGFYTWGLMVLGIMLLARPILLVYGGASFLSSVNLLRILMIGAWFLPLSSLVAPYYVKMGAFGLASTTALILGVLSIALNFILVPRYAEVGAALATTFTCITGFCLVLLLLWYLSKKNPLVFFKITWKDITLGKVK
ncbi:MAG: oligosaccharide flippase family protein [Desulfobaccales bacterium]